MLLSCFSICLPLILALILAFISPLILALMYHIYIIFISYLYHIYIIFISYLYHIYLLSVPFPEFSAGGCLEDAAVASGADRLAGVPGATAGVAPWRKRLEMRKIPRSREMLVQNREKLHLEIIELWKPSKTAKIDQWYDQHKGDFSWFSTNRGIKGQPQWRGSPNVRCWPLWTRLNLHHFAYTMDHWPRIQDAPWMFSQQPLLYVSWVVTGSLCGL